MKSYTNSAYSKDIELIPGKYMLNKDSQQPHPPIDISTIFDINNITPNNNNSSNNNNNNNNEKIQNVKDKNQLKKPEKQRINWGNDIEFLMSCIALSVGLGNVWRFPFVALENGGGAFVIPYLIVLMLVGKPVYYLEMIIGQFSSRSSIKVFDFAPAMRGVGYGQVLSTTLVTAYYASLMALTIRYFIASFSEILPWGVCNTEWGEYCINSTLKNVYSNNSINNITANSTQNVITSAEFYFYKNILNEVDTINNGIGYPDWKLVLCLAVSWIVITSVLIKGIQSSGKASYFLAIFPYVIMFILLIRSVTLPGSLNGIKYFLTPQWDQLLNPKVWYAAVTQVFFSLAICFGNIIMYSSYNRFSHNIYKDVTIVTTLDTMTSLLAGIIIFGILGNLAYETDANDITTVVKGGAGLAFISYPDAIAKFEYLPQIYSILFFFMLFVLGIGSNIGMASCTITAIVDRFPNVKHSTIVMSLAIVQFLIGCIYVTPGGQYILNLIDFFGASFVAFVLAIAELIAFGWIYGVNRLCHDIEFMLDLKTGLYWRLCWGIFTPIFMTAILVYHLIDLQPLKYHDYVYPNGAYIFGWCLSAFGILQLPFWAIYAIYKQNGNDMFDKIKKAFKPTSNWGPMESELNKKYQEYTNERKNKLFKRNHIWMKIKNNLFG